MTAHENAAPLGGTVRLKQVTIDVCQMCLDGDGGECHVPGCAFWMSRAPDVPMGTAQHFGKTAQEWHDIALEWKRKAKQWETHAKTAQRDADLLADRLVEETTQAGGARG